MGNATFRSSVGLSHLNRHLFKSFLRQIVGHHRLPHKKSALRAAKGHRRIISAKTTWKFRIKQSLILRLNISDNTNGKMLNKNIRINIEKRERNTGRREHWRERQQAHRWTTPSRISYWWRRDETQHQEDEQQQHRKMEVVKLARTSSSRSKMESTLRMAWLATSTTTITPPRLEWWSCMVLTHRCRTRVGRLHPTSPTTSQKIINENVGKTTRRNTSNKDLPQHLSLTGYTWHIAIRSSSPTLSGQAIRTPTFRRFAWIDSRESIRKKYFRGTCPDSRESHLLSDSHWHSRNSRQTLAAIPCFGRSIRKKHFETRINSRESAH